MTHWQNSSKQLLTATPQSKSSHGGLRDQSLLGNTEMQHTSAMWTTSGNWQDIRKKGNEYNIIIDRIHYTQTSCPPDFNLAPLHCCWCTQIFCRHKNAKSFKFSRELPLSPTRQKPYDKSFFSRPTTSTESSWYCRHCARKVAHNKTGSCNLVSLLYTCHRKTSTFWRCFRTQDLLSTSKTFTSAQWVLPVSQCLVKARRSTPAWESAGRGSCCQRLQLQWRRHSFLTNIDTQQQSPCNGVDNKSMYE